MSPTPGSGGTTGGGGTALQNQAVTEHLQAIGSSPTQMLTFFEQVCRQSVTSGIREQQLLDVVNRIYNEKR
jgi:hypothetical protein